jgi:predicted TIM-barrel fold metal-dependent hydrolase
MRNGIKVMDSDMHVREPRDLWEKYLEQEWRDRGPKIISEPTRSGAMVLLEGKILKGYPPMRRSAIGSSVMDKKLPDAIASGFDAASQLKAMDTEGLDVAVLYPSIGLGILMRPEMDPKLAAAIARAYNNWLYDFCQTDPHRLKGVGMVALHDITEGVKEANRVVTELGFVGVFARCEPVTIGLPWHSKYYDLLWAELEELGVPIGFHTATSLGEVPQTGDRFGDNNLLRQMTSHPMENMLAMVDIILGGVLERHPRLKVAFLECCSGWVPCWLSRMDSEVKRQGGLKLKPSEYFKGQCWVGAEAEKEIPMVIHYIGDNNIVFSTDYPHATSDYPRATEEFFRIEGLTDENKRKILWDNCARLYGLGMNM